MLRARLSKLDGKDTMVKKLLRFTQRFPDQIGLALRQETEIEATEVKKRTPVDTTPHAPHPGRLRSTVHVVGPSREGLTKSKIYCLIVAGGNLAPYAIYVHENLEAIHPIGQAKYIESVILESRSHMAVRVASRMRANKAMLASIQ